MHHKYFKGVQYAVLATVAYASMPALSCPDYEYTYMGTICYTAATFCPRGYTEANGQLLDTGSNPALFSLLGTQYGGNGRTTFALPNLNRRALVGAGNGENLTPRLRGQTFGQEYIQLTTNELPTHTGGNKSYDLDVPSQIVQVPVSTQPGKLVGPQGKVYLAARTDDALIYSASTVKSEAQIPINVTGGDFTLNAETDSVGQGMPVVVTQPSLMLRACIAVLGDYPTRPH